MEKKKDCCIKLFFHFGKAALYLQTSFNYKFYLCVLSAALHLFWNEAVIQLHQLQQQQQLGYYYHT